MQPLSPPVFSKIATHSKNLRFFILFVFGFACFQLVVIFVDFHIPWHPAGEEWDENGAKTDPLGCFLIQFRSTLPNKKHNPQHHEPCVFVTLAPKPDFHLHCDQPQHETHNLQHTLSDMNCGCFGIPFLDRCLRMFFFTLQIKNKVLTRSAGTNLQAPLAETDNETPVHAPSCRTFLITTANTAQQSHRILGKLLRNRRVSCSYCSRAMGPSH